MKTLLHTTLFFFLVLFSSTAASGQTYSIGHTTLNLTDSTRNRSIPAEVYYPADSNGDNVPVSTLTNDRFPILAFGHGFVMSWDAYTNIWEALVPQGYIMIFPTTETGFSPAHLELGKDLAFVVEALKQEGSNTGSLLYNRVDSLSCVMGHSMGGGASFLAMQFNSSITAIATLSAAETNPSAIGAAAGITVPALVLAGENDCVTPPVSNQMPMYDSLHSICKSLVTIHGGSHCQMANTNFFCDFGEASCTPAPAITRADQHVILNRYLISWLNAELKGSCADGLIFDSLLTSDPAVSAVSTCPLCIPNSIPNLSDNSDFSVFPNPSSEKIFLKGVPANKEILLFNSMGKLVRQLRSGAEGTAIDPGGLPAGIYLLKIGGIRHSLIRF